MPRRSSQQQLCLSALENPADLKFQLRVVPQFIECLEGSHRLRPRQISDEEEPRPAVCGIPDEIDEHVQIRTSRHHVDSRAQSLLNPAAKLIALRWIEF